MSFLGPANQDVGCPKADSLPYMEGGRPWPRQRGSIIWHSLCNQHVIITSKGINSNFIISSIIPLWSHFPICSKDFILFLFKPIAHPRSQVAFQYMPFPPELQATIPPLPVLFFPKTSTFWNVFASYLTFWNFPVVSWCWLVLSPLNVSSRNTGFHLVLTCWQKYLELMLGYFTLYHATQHITVSCLTISNVEFGERWWQLDLSTDLVCFPLKWVKKVMWWYLGTWKYPVLFFF